MSGAPIGPRGGGSYDFRTALRDVVLALLALNCAVFPWQGDRIEHDCSCSHPARLAIQWGTAAIVGAVAVWPLWLAFRAWRRGGPGWLRRLVGDERHHVVAALVPWITAIIGVLLLDGPSQTADMLSGLQGDDWTGIARPLIPFGFGALAWDLATWFCGRWSIDIERGAAGRVETVLARWNPRLISLLTGFAIVIVTVQAAGLCSRTEWVASGVAAVVVAFAVLRRPVVRLFRPAWRSGGPRRRVTARQTGGTWRTRLPARWAAFGDDLRAAPGGIIAVLAALALSVAAIGWFALSPLSAGHWLQAPGTVLLGIGCLTMIATFLSKFLRRLAGWPVLWLFVAASLVLGRGDFGVDHDIRTLPGPEMAAPDTLDQAAEAWLRTCGPGLAPEGTPNLNVVLVSTAGGASRAALWTFDALVDLRDRDPRFPRRVFAISAVSGGALGATVWSALLAHFNFDCRADLPDAWDPKGEWRARGQAILSHDFLAPVLAAALSRDLLLGWVPLRHFGITVEDRSATLERAWEVAWAQAFDGQDQRLAEDFLTLWNGTFNRPLLLLNGTVEQSGQPVITAPIAIVDARGNSYGDLPATYDARWLLHKEIRTSTAVLNAARFPVITSQGDIRVRRCPDGTIFAKRHCESEQASDDVLSVVDGGYFDNIGAGTTIRAAAALVRAFHRLRTEQHMFAGTNLRIMVVGINSDPDRLISAKARNLLDPKAAGNAAIDPPIDQLMRCRQEPSTLTVAAASDGNAMDNAVAPFLAIVATQAGHTTLRMAELNDQFCPATHGLRRTLAGAKAPALDWSSDYVMLSLCPMLDGNGSISLPLNWTLSNATRALFAGNARFDLTRECGNREEFAAYATWAGQ